MKEMTRNGEIWVCGGRMQLISMWESLFKKWVFKLRIE